MKANRPERPSVLYHGESQSREESKYLSRLRLYTNNTLVVYVVSHRGSALASVTASTSS